MPFTDTFANSILAWMTARGTFPYSDEIYIGLGNSAEGSAGINELPATNGYERVIIAKRGADKDLLSIFDDASFVEARTVKNSKQINWKKADPGDWPTANAFLLSTSKEVGETSAVFFVGLLDQPMTCVAGAVALFDPGELKIQISTKDEKIT